MKLSKNQLNEYIQLYLNDAYDIYNNDDENITLSENILENIKNTLQETEGDAFDMLKEVINKAEPKHKEILKDFLIYIKYTE